MDDVAALLADHLRSYFAAHEPGTLEVGIEHTVPVGFLDFVRGAEDAHAGIVDEDEGIAELLANAGDEAAHGFGGGDIRGEAQGLNALRLQNLRGMSGGTGRAGAESDTRSQTAQTAGNGQADAAAGSGDDGKFVRQGCIFFHRRPPGGMRSARGILA